MSIQEILDQYKSWIENKSDSKANLCGANLRWANLSLANLNEADLSLADLHGADLHGADLSKANLSGANLSKANLNEANLRKANLCGANLRWANLSLANLNGANLHGTDLREVNLSGAEGLLKSSDWISQFEIEDEKLVVFKAIGQTDFKLASYWKIKAGLFLEEVVNSVRTDNCGCGVNFGTLEYITKIYPNSDIWKCYIHPLDVADVVVPYNTNGKARCARLQLVEKIRSK